MDLPDHDPSCEGTRDWPHAPPHRLSAAGVYFITARTLDRVPHFEPPARRTFVRDSLLALASHYGWRLEAWAVMSNHYHCVVHSPATDRSATSLPKFLRHLHGDVTRRINREDDTPGRAIWHNYRETYLNLEHGYLARLAYTHNNPVHHKLVVHAKDYEWCSASAFEQACTRAWVNTIYSFKFDQIASVDGDD